MNQFTKPTKSEPIDFSKYSFMHPTAGANPTPPTSSGVPGHAAPGTPATNHKYIDRKPDPRHPGKYIYIYELPNGKQQLKNDEGLEVNSMPVLPAYKQNSAQYTHSTVNGIPKDKRAEYDSAKASISEITKKNPTVKSRENLNTVHPKDQRNFVVGHDGNYYNISDYDEKDQETLRKHQETYKTHMKPHWEHIAEALEKGLKVPDEVIDNYPVPSTRAHLQYLRAIRKPEFKNWFGDWENEPHEASKVTDAEGKPTANNHRYDATAPKVLYHGTPQGGFRKFEKHKDKGSNLFGEGFYFTDNYEVAEAYANRQQGEAGKSYNSEFRGFTDRTGKDVKQLSYGGVTMAIEAIKTRFKNLDDHDFDNLVTALKKAEEGSVFNTEKFIDTINEISKGHDEWTDKTRELNNMYLQPFVEEYARVSGTTIKKSGSEVFHTFLNIRNPFDMEGRLLRSSFDGMKKSLLSHFDNGEVHFERLFDKWDNDTKAAAFHAGFNHSEPTKIKDITWYHLLKLKQILKNTDKHRKVFSRSGDNDLTFTEMHYLLSGGNRDSKFMEKFGKYLQKSGYDGVTYQGGWENPTNKKHRVYVAFNPNQIKSVDNKTFNAKDNNIYKSLSKSLINPYLNRAQTYEELHADTRHLF